MRLAFAMRGSWHDKRIREYKIDDKGMHIGRSFHNVGGIISGAAVQAVAGESAALGGMFEEDLAAHES